MKRPRMDTDGHGFGLANSISELSSRNVAGWDAATVEMLSLWRGGEIEPLPVFYDQLARQCGGGVLVLVSGLGVRAVQLARAGFRVTCIDLSEHMIAHTRRRLENEAPEVRSRVELRCADVRAPIGRQFGLIILVDWDFHQMFTQEDQLACLRAIRESLSPDGLAVLDLFSPPYKMNRDHTLTGKPMVWDKPLPDGRTIRRTTTSEFDHMTQIETMHVTFEVFRDGEVERDHRCAWPLRHTSLWEFELLLRTSGLEPVLRCDDFDLSLPMDQQVPMMTGVEDYAYVVKRAEGAVIA